MRRLINFRPDDSILDIAFETVFLVLFTLAMFIMACGAIALIVFAAISLTEGAVT